MDLMEGILWLALNIYFEENPKDIRLIIEKAVDAVTAIVEDGADLAMNHFN